MDGQRIRICRMVSRRLPLVAVVAVVVVVVVAAV